MSSTSNVQNVLANIVRPRYGYDLTHGYVARVDMSNVNELIAGTITTDVLNLTDANNNVRVGTGTSTSTALSNSVLFGVNAGSSTNSFTVNPTGNVILGTNAGRNVGSSNIYIGYGAGTTASGSGNILIGAGMDLSSGSNTLLIGNASGPSLAANLSTKYVGIGTIEPAFTLDVLGNARVDGGRLGINMEPTIYHLGVNGNVQIQNGYGKMEILESRTNDVSGIHMTLTAYSNNSATIRTEGKITATTGFVSLQGTAVDLSSIPIKIGDVCKGTMMLHAQTSDGSIFDIRTVNSTNGTSFTSVTPQIYDISGFASSTTFYLCSNSSIYLQNPLYADSGTPNTLLWRITYFPLT